MAKFRIDATRQHSGDALSEFDVTWLDGCLSVGDVFGVQEAGHRWDVRIVEVREAEGGATLICAHAVHWNDQYAPAVVDTGAPPQEQFRYMTT